jgi:hypothetical protein
MKPVMTYNLYFVQARGDLLFRHSARMTVNKP